MKHRVRSTSASLAFAASLSCGVLSIATLSACGSSDSNTSSEADTTVTTAAPTTAAPTEADALSIDDAWVKAAESGMSAAFGVLVNSSDADVTIVSASSDASPMIELHETVETASGEMMMQEKQGGFVVPAGGEYPLQPGANHLMLMGLSAPVNAGDEVNFELTMSDGSTVKFSAVAKDYSGANERYDGAMSGHGS